METFPFHAFGMAWLMVLTRCAREFMGLNLRRVASNVGMNYLLPGRDGQPLGVLWEILMLFVSLMRDWVVIDLVFL